VEVKKEPALDRPIRRDVLRWRYFQILYFAACSKSVLTYMKARKNLHTRRWDYNWFYSLKVLEHFRSKLWVDFLHVPTQINCLTGSIIARHVSRIYILISYDTILCNSMISAFWHWWLVHATPGAERSAPLRLPAWRHSLSSGTRGGSFKEIELSRLS